MQHPGPRNSLTDIEGLRVGNAEDEAARTGATLVLCDTPAIAGVHVMGGAPGTRETDLLAPDKTVERVDAIVLSGGSAFGLDAAGSVASALAAQGRGFAVGDVRVPIVPAAILFDLLNGGRKDWGETPPYARLGREALAHVAGDFAIGSAGAGFGATTATVRGGLGSASCVLDNGITIAALVAVNALGSPLIGRTRHFWAAPFEIGDEFGGLGLPSPLPDDATALRLKGVTSDQAPQNTTIGVIASDAILSKAQATRLAVAAHDGLARALWPAHTPLDGDAIFALSTEKRPLADPIADMLALSAAASSCMARAIARGIHAARPMPGDFLPCWEQL